MGFNWGKRMIAAIAMLTTVAAYAQTIDTDKYFGYAFGGLNGKTYFLSKDDCNLSKLDGYDGETWKHAIVYQTAGSSKPTPACWSSHGNFIGVCTYPARAACFILVKSQFIDTATLPKQAGF